MTVDHRRILCATSMYELPRTHTNLGDRYWTASLEQPASPPYTRLQPYSLGVPSLADDTHLFCWEPQRLVTVARPYLLTVRRVRQFYQCSSFQNSCWSWCYLQLLVKSFFLSAFMQQTSHRALFDIASVTFAFSLRTLRCNSSHLCGNCATDHHHHHQRISSRRKSYKNFRAAMCHVFH